MLATGGIATGSVEGNAGADMGAGGLLHRECLSSQAFNVIFGRRSLSGSAIGGLPETQEMLDYCAESGIVSDIELIPIQQINQAYDRLLKGDVKYRFVIDNASLKQ
jgi:D-arabinose 1-dehydrogenase-like Zn-dependent alcohol dehydrogenase